jgi:hypothetical protein
MTTMKLFCQLHQIIIFLFLAFYCFYCFIIHMCIQGLGHFSPLPLPAPLPPTPPPPSPPPPQYPAEIILPLSLTLLEEKI